ncbi:MAG: hypothetical protein U0798_10910 [Gemmataceae bacterium]
MFSHWLRRPFLWITALVSLASFTGCSGNTGGVGPPMVEEEAVLKEFNELIHCGTGKVTKLTDLSRYEQQFPRAYQAVKSGTVVVNWNIPPMGEGDMAKGGGVPLAYEKVVPTSGGWVLLTDGKVKKMTADEYKSASNAKN